MERSILNPKNWTLFGGNRNKALEGKPLTARESAAQGPFSTLFNQFVLREAAPDLYEALREGVPVIDAAINRLVTLDGIVRVEGDNDKLTQEITNWMQNVRVGDMQEGFQAFYAGMGNEMYEQGFSIGEPTLDKTKSEVIRLDVSDSKGIYFYRSKSGELDVYYRRPSQRTTLKNNNDKIERILRNNYNISSGLAAYLDDNGYKRLNRGTLIYAGLNVEAGNPYGVSLIRSMEFVTQVLLTIDNALLQTWKRFGSPSFDVQYKTKSKISEAELEERRKQIADNLKAAMETRNDGNTTDLINALGINDEIVVNILGAGNDVLELQYPAKHILEQLVAKTGLPPWILGYVWGTAERLALKQAELLRQESKTRFELRRPGLTRIVATHLRAKGFTWKEGDWALTQELPNLEDILALAQADFLQAQTEMMRNNAGNPAGASVAQSGKVLMPVSDDFWAMADKGFFLTNGRQKALGGEPPAEDDPELPKIEARIVRSLMKDWRALYTDVLSVLGLETGKAAKAEGPVFMFDAGAMLTDLVQLETAFINRVGSADAELASQIYQTWLRGLLNSAAEFEGVDAVTDSVRELNRVEIAERSMAQVRVTAVRALREDIITDLQNGVYDGLNPRDVARQLRKRFEIHGYDWERLARSEMTDAHARAKLEQYKAHETSDYNYTTAGDSLVSTICRSLAAGGPYPVGGGPLPMTSSHPNCRCTITAVID